MKQDREILRELVRRYVEIAAHERNAENAKLHRAVNDLHPIRPIVLIGAIPWHEMNYEGWLDLHCQDPYLRSVEEYLRQTIYQWTFFPADMIVLPYLGVRKVIYHSGIGVDVQEDEINNNQNQGISSHHYENQFTCEQDLEKLHFDTITYDEDLTKQRYELLANLVGDLIPVKIIGADTGYGLGCITWDIIATLMGVDDLLYNLIDEPEFMHCLVAKFTDIFLDQMRQYEELNLFNADAIAIQHSATLSDDLQRTSCDPDHVTMKNVWGRGLAQILETVSPAMHKEFDIDYMVKAMEPFGLVYYGCCEALHHKVDILRKITNLRKISMSPWADVTVGAEVIGRDYVLSAKPNPATVATPTVNLEVLSKDIRKILSASTTHQCATEIVLKDISTVHHRPQNLFEWENTVMGLVKNA